ncbi:MAG: efflux RND transporter permease subunit, partial [Candidatus Saccharibacteria bacterium]|nr:efflux RND transporter permease subunit [Candidatus Saccharibacteria bacterium]
FSFRRSKTNKTRTFKPIANIEESVSNGLAKLLKWSVGTKTRSISTKLHAVLISLMFVVGGGLIFKNVEFNIFPAPKDGSEILISAQIKNRESANISQTEEFTSALLNKVKDLVGEDLQRISLTAGSAADRDGFNAYVTLNSIGDRQRTSVQIADTLQSELEALVPEMRIAVSSAGVGPPTGNFSVQIKGDDIDKTSLLATDVAKFLETETLKRIDGSEAKFLEVRTTPQNIVSRSDGDRIVNVSADFDGTDVSALVELAKKAVTQEFNFSRVESYGLSSDSLGFDLGQEEENQKSFESMGKAAGPLFIVMFIVMALLFKNILQPILILTALPFALFGVAGGLYITDNPISFFAMLGVFALVGISLNNTILLTDYANQAQKEGMNPVDAMSSAIKHRLRPLMTTSITSVLALLPLALNDPFWEGLAYTLVYGLISSTLLVVLVFPYFYLIEEVISSKISAISRKIFKKPT